MKSDDAELIQRTLAGDNNAFSELVKKYQKQVHALAWRKVGDFHTAEDITQDTFLKAYQRLHTLKEPQRFAGWLYVIATRRCLAWFRKKRLQKQVLENVGTPATNKDAYSRHVAEEQAKTVDKEQQEVVKKLLETLQESDRTVITLHYFGEMTCEEMSEFLGVSANTIKSRLRRARNRLKKEEPMIREAISNFQISPNLTDNIMREVNRLKPAAPSGSKPLLPWVIGAASTVMIVLMLGIGSQYLANFQQPYSLDAQSERTIELIDMPIAQNVEVKLDVQNQLVEHSDTGGRGDGNEKEANQALNKKGDYTQWNLPEKATARLAKGRIYGISFSPDGTRIAVGSTTGVWIYDVHTGTELALLTDHNHTSRIGKVAFSPDGKTLATGLTSKILLWDTTTGKLLKTFKKEGVLIKALSIVDDGKTLLSENYDGSVRLWDITTGVKKDFRPAHSSDLRGIPKYIMGHEVIAADLYLSNVDNKGIFAVGDVFGKIWLEDAMTGRHLKTLEDHKDRISQLAFSPDGTLLASADYSNAPLRLWDVTTGNLLKTLTHNPSLRGILTFSKDGKTLACQTRGGEIELWHVATKTLCTTLSGKIDGAIQELAFSPDSKTVAGAYWNGEIQVWDVNTGEVLFSFPTGHIPAPGVLTFSPDSKILAVRQGSAIRLLDSLTFTQLTNIQLLDSLTYLELSKRVNTNEYAVLVFSPDGSSVTSAKAFTFTKETRVFANETRDVFVKESVLGMLSVWDTHTGDKLSNFQVGITRGEIPDLSGQIRSGKATSTTKPVIFSQDGYMIATVLNSKEVTKDYRFTVLLWEVWEDPRRQLHFTLKGHTDKINALAFTPNGKMIASGSDDGIIRLWDTSTGTQMLSLTSGKTNALVFSMDSKILASINNSVSIQLWDVGTGTQLAPFKGQNDSATVLAFSTDSKILASGSTDGTIRLWNISTGNELTTFKGHINRVNALSFSPDGKMLASGSIDGAIFLWSISD